MVTQQAEHRKCNQEHDGSLSHHVQAVIKVALKSIHSFMVFVLCDTPVTRQTSRKF